VGKPGRQRAEAGELLALAEQRLHAAQAGDSFADDRERHVRAGSEQLADRADRDLEHLGRAGGSDRSEPPAALERRDLALQRPRPDTRDRDHAPPGALRDVHLSRQHDVQRIGLIALANEQVAGGKIDDLPHLHQPMELHLVQAAEQRGVAKPVDDRLAAEMLVRDG
jgi:hypothetical protein